MPAQMGGRMGSHMTGGQMTSRMGAMPGHPYPGKLKEPCCRIVTLLIGQLKKFLHSLDAGNCIL